MTDKELLKLKEDINSAKTEASKLKGKQQYLLQQLETEWECKTVEQARKKLRTLEQSIDTLNTRIQTDIQALEEQYLNKEQ